MSRVTDLVVLVGSDGDEAGDPEPVGHDADRLQTLAGDHVHAHNVQARLVHVHRVQRHLQTDSGGVDLALTRFNT